MKYLIIILLLSGCAANWPIQEEAGLTVVQFDTNTVRRMCGDDAEWNHHVYGGYFEQVRLLICDEGDRRVCSEHACMIVKQLRGEKDLEACHIPVPSDLTRYIRWCTGTDQCLDAINSIR